MQQGLGIFLLNKLKKLLYKRELIETPYRLYSIKQQQ